MPVITVQATTIPDYHGGGSAATLKIFVSDNFLDDDGIEHVAGHGYFYKSVACTITGTNISIPQFTLESTTDSNVDTAKYVAELYSLAGVRIAVLLSGNEFSVYPAPTTLTWEILDLINRAPKRRLPDGYYTAQQTEQRIRDLVGAAEWGSVSGTITDQDDLQAVLDTKQNQLESAVTLKTVNGINLLGSGNATIDGFLPDGAVIAGADLELAGQLSISGGDTLVGGTPTAIEETSQADFAAGTLSNTTAGSDGTLALTDAANGTAKAVRFRGDRSNKILVPHNAAYNLAGDLTIESWANLENATAFSPIISKGNSGGPFDFVIQSGGGFAPGNYGWLRFGQGGEYTSTEVSAALRLNRWHHVAVVKQSGVVQFYVNGVSIGSRAFNPTVPTNTSDVTIGHATDGTVPAGYLFRGSLRDVRLWNLARSAGDISSNKDSTLIGNETGLVGNWKLDEGTGTAIDDISATANDGVLSGADYSWQTVTSNYASSGTRTSPEYNVSSAKTISTSLISWVEVKPTGTTILVETRYSTDGGLNYSAWQTCTNGSAIPGLNSTTDLSNGRLQIRQILTTPSSKLTPSISSLSASFTTPSFQYDLGIRNANPEATVDADIGTIQGRVLDTGGAVINVASPRYGGIDPTGVLPCDDAVALAMADLGAANTFSTSTGKIVFPKGVYYFANDLELNHIVVLEGAGGDVQAPATTLDFADGKGIIIPPAEVFGGYGTDQGAGKGSVLRDFKVTTRGKANAPTSTVDVSGLTVTRTAGTVFDYERWGAHQIVKIDNIYARVAGWTSSSQCTLTPLYYYSTVSGNTVTSNFGNAFPAGLTGVAVKINGVSYNLHASTPSTTSVLTLSSSPAETGNQVVEIQSLGTLSGQTMSIFVNHGIEIQGTAHLQNVSTSGFAGNGIDLNTASWNYDNARNCNLCNFYNVTGLDNEGHGLFVLSSNANACTFAGVNGFNNRGSGIHDASQFGNTYIGPHADSNRMWPFYAESSSSVVGLYTEGNQPPSKFVRAGGTSPTGSGPVILAGFHGAGFTYDTNAMNLSDGGTITGCLGLTLPDVSTGIQSGHGITFTETGEYTKGLNFGYGANGSTESGVIFQSGKALHLFTNTAGAAVVPTDPAVPSWWGLFDSASDRFRILRAAATAGTPTFVEKLNLSATGELSVDSLLLANSAPVTKVLSGIGTLDFGSIGSNAVATLDITVTGVIALDEATVTVTPRGVPAAGLIWSGSITADDVVTVRLANITGAPIDPAATDWRASVMYF